MGKGQVSVEYILVVGFAFLMIIPLIVVFYDSSGQMSSSVILSQTEKIAREIAAAADQVYFQGVPSTRTIKVFMPEDVKEVIIEDNYIQIVTNSMKGTPASSVANLSGRIGTYPGLHIIRITAEVGGVIITDGTDN